VGGAIGSIGSSDNSASMVVTLPGGAHEAFMSCFEGCAHDDLNPPRSSSILKVICFTGDAGVDKLGVTLGDQASDGVDTATASSGNACADSYALVRH
jgi:hypothetical protein